MGLYFDQPADALQPTGSSAFSSAWPQFPESSNVQDRTDWNQLGYSDSGDVYYQDGAGNVWAQPLTHGYAPDLDHPEGAGTWGEPQFQGQQYVPDGPGAGGRLHTDDPTFDKDGKPHFKCRACGGG